MGAPKLTRSQADQLRVIHDEGFASFSELARLHGLARNTIIRAVRCWGEYPEELDTRTREERRRASARKYAEKNPGVRKQIQKRYREANREKLKAYRSTPEYKERHRLAQAAYVARNRDRSRFIDRMHREKTRAEKASKKAAGSR